MKQELHIRSALAGAAIAAITFVVSGAALQDKKADPVVSKEKKDVQVQYLEIVTPDLDKTCRALEKLHGVAFSKPEAALGNSRTAALKGGGRIGVRAPMRETEEPVVRPYILVDDIDAAAKAAEAAGGEIAHPPFEIPGQGKFAIYVLGGIQHGLWQL
jgi:predicted enzyme related to lactoylglutathione lyase